MTENRSTTTPPQDPDPEANLRSVKFVKWLFGDLAERTFLAGSVPGSKRVTPEGYYSDDKMLAMPANQRHHVSSGIYPPDLPPKRMPDGTMGKLPSRDESRIELVPCVVFDDIGVAAPPGTVSLHGVEIDESEFAKLPLKPGWTMLTRAGRSQYGFAFNPMPDLEVATILHDQLKAHPVFGRGLHSLGQYFRTPSGCNTKPDGGDFATKLTSIGEACTVEEFAAAFGLSLTMAPRAKASATGETCDIGTLRAIIALLPNDDWFDKRDMDRWGLVGMALFGASDGSDEARELWLEWCASWFTIRAGMKVLQAGDPDLDAKFWDTLVPGNVKASVSTLRRIVQARFGSTSAEYRRAGELTAQPKAQAAFEAIPDAQPMPEAKAKQKLDDVLAAIHAVVKVPDHHAKRDFDDNWLPKAGGLLDIGSLARSLPVAPPILFEPYVRGGLSVMGGAPSIGKSNLILDQVLAVAADRADLLRDGSGRLQFAGDVLYVSNEDDIRVVQRRAAAWGKHWGVDLTAMKHKLLVVRTGLLRKHGDNWTVECMAVLERVLEHVKGGSGIAMIVVDTLATTVIGADEQQIRDMGEVMRLLQKLAATFWGSVVFLHHTVKEAWVRGAADLTARSLATIRGSGGIVGNHTRGATLVVAPDRAELDRHPDWVGRDIIVEYMLKANDGRESYPVCYYERVLVDVSQISATDATVVETRKEPVLVPLAVTPLGQDMVKLQEYLDILTKWPAEIRIVEKIAPNGSPNSVQAILGVSNGAAKTIVDGLVSWGVASVKTTKINRHDVVILEISGPF